eukprot:scaffold29967_cov17-Tisochrysis_lutea.AAC.4
MAPACRSIGRETRMANRLCIQKWVWSNLAWVNTTASCFLLLQVIDAVLANPEDRTKLTLVYANQTPGDIILKERLDALAAQHPDRFSVHYVVDRPGWLGMFWKGSVGYITKVCGLILFRLKQCATTFSSLHAQSPARFPLHPVPMHPSLCTLPCAPCPRGRRIPCLSS